MNTSQSGSKELSKQLEYVKQQQQLRALGNVLNNTNPKVLSAESMIEDLLSKKETFQKRNPQSQQKQEVPGWLAGATHPLYERVWLGVQSSGRLADTPLLSSLLMSSGLTTDTLGYIWSLANHTVPGALTQPELYLVLALVALAQTGYVVNNLAAVYQLPQAPVPTVDLTLLPARQMYPSPLNIASLPDPPTLNWVAHDAFYSNSSSDKIGISYVSSGPMVSPKLLSDQTTKISNLNITDLNTADNIAEQKNIISNNLPMNVGFDSKTSAHTTHSANTYSFSFPSLSESPSHIGGEKLDDTDPFDDEFTDFQSAHFTSGPVSAQVATHSNSMIDDEDEFTNFQKASPTFDNDDLSVLVIGGRNIPSAQQLWVADSSSVAIEQEKLCRINTENKEICNNPDAITKDIPNRTIRPGLSDENKYPNENKYDAFQEIGDKYSVFHNPIPDDEDNHRIVSSSVMESVHAEAKSIFRHSLFNDPEPPLDLYKFNHQTSTLELPKFGTDRDATKVNVDEDDDDEYCNFQNFPVHFPENENIAPSENVDKYDVFRTIVFHDTAFEPNSIQISKTDEETEDKLSHMQSFEADMAEQNKVDHDQKREESNLFGNNLGTQIDDGIKFDDFQESVALASNSNIDTLFSSLAISEKSNEIEIKQDTPSTSGPAEDRYKALRLLETSTVETDDFGEFLGAEVSNSGNEAQNMQQASIQIRCLEACLNLLKDGLSTLSRASSPEVISEILSDPRANTYLDCLLEIYRVSQRILAHMDSDCCAALSTDLHSVWETLAPYFSHTEHNHLIETVGAVCGVCRSNTGPSPVTFGALSFHTPCANLYLHCVEPVLPNIPAVQ